MTLRYAATEVLTSSLRRYCKLAHRQREVDGQAADVYSAGAVLYQQMTGEVPFDITGIDLTQIDVPNEVSEPSREHYRQSIAMMRLHTDWVRATVKVTQPS